MLQSRRPSWAPVLKAAGPTSPKTKGGKPNPCPSTGKPTYQGGLLRPAGTLNTLALKHLRRGHAVQKTCLQFPSSAPGPAPLPAWPSPPAQVSEQGWEITVGHSQAEKEGSDQAEPLSASVSLHGHQSLAGFPERDRAGPGSPAVPSPLSSGLSGTGLCFSRERCTPFSTWGGDLRLSISAKPSQVAAEYVVGFWGERQMPRLSPLHRHECSCRVGDEGQISAFLTQYPSSKPCWRLWGPLAETPSLQRRKGVGP